MSNDAKKPEATVEEERRAFLTRAAKLSLAVPAATVLLRSKMAKAVPPRSGLPG